ncbi:MAG: hypothetical protein ACK5HZ_12275 [Macellibacteroides fermentans]|uniref:hypothetical protein n=1 Tax=Macellibacteroides fermentans TaxID=879969 RepID=UPI003AC76E49
MNIEGVNFTSGMIAEIRTWQQDPEALRSTLDVLDESISFIATESAGCDSIKAGKSLRTISDLCFIKNILSKFDGKEINE